MLRYRIGPPPRRRAQTSRRVTEFNPDIALLSEEGISIEYDADLCAHIIYDSKTSSSTTTTRRGVLKVDNARRVVSRNKLHVIHIYDQVANGHIKAE